MNCEVTAPDRQVAWFFQKGLGSRLLLNALNRFRRCSGEFRPGFEDLWIFFGNFRSVEHETDETHASVFGQLNLPRD